jgi:beta-galactosidase
MTVSVGDTGLTVDGRHVPVYSGAVHYWRLDRERWPLILDRVQSLGFQMIETYIPWSVHETSPGVFDWGERDPRKNIDAFMRLCEEHGLWLLVRPGPLINAELTDFGFPEWVLLDPAVQARTSLGSLHLDAAWGLHPPRPFPVPSYASERFFELTGGWYDVVCPIIARHLAPRGCVVAVQSDNETCYLFHDQPYATDYSPDSLRLYRSFLRQLHRDVQTLNRVYGSSYASFDDVDPPRDGPIETRDDAPFHLDWVAYKEYQIRWSVARFARMLRERGMRTVPIFHDVAYQYRTPLDISRLETDPDIDWVGLNLYRPPWEHAPLADRARFLAGSTRLPFVPELGAGIWSHHVATPTPSEQEFVNLSVLMYGIKAFNFYMLVERERWQGSPITRHGECRTEYASFYAQLLEFLTRFEFWRFRRAPRPAVLLSYDLERFEAANSTLNYGHVDLYGLPPELFDATRDLGLKWVQSAGAWLQTLKQTLHTAGIDYDLADTHLADSRLAHYPLVFVQSADFMDSADQLRLLEYVEHGGHVALGPGVPDLDAYLQPCSLLAEPVAQGRIRHVAEAELADVVRALLPSPEFRVDDARLDLVAHHDGPRQLLFIANPTTDGVCAKLHFQGSRSFESAWGPAKTASGDGHVEVRLDGYQVQVWQVREPVS